MFSAKVTNHTHMIVLSSAQWEQYNQRSLSVSLGIKAVWGIG